MAAVSARTASSTRSIFVITHATRTDSASAMAFSSFTTCITHHVHLTNQLAPAQFYSPGVTPGESCRMLCMWSELLLYVSECKVVFHAWKCQVICHEVPAQ
eukprot:jgi/Ulvmu1/11516/UM078_0005.1